MRHAERQINHCHDHALADPYQHQSVDRAAHRQDRLAPDPLAGSAQQTVARDPELRDNRIAIAQQKEQGDQREGKDHQAVKQSGADQLRPRDQGGAAEMVKLLGRGLRRGEVGLPPLGYHGAAKGQVMQPRGRGHAVRARHRDPMRHIGCFARGLGDPDRDRNDDQQGNGQRGKRGKQVAAPTEPARFRPGVGRIDRDRDHHRPDQRRQETEGDPQPEKTQAQGEQHLRDGGAPIAGGIVCSLLIGHVKSSRQTTS